MQVQPTEFNVQTLQKELICPVLSEPLSQAVSLVPCAHKVQQAVAEKMFGATNGGWLVQSDNPCPVCSTSVLGYMADHSTRNIVKQLFGLQENEINAMLTLMKKNLAEKSKSVEKDVLVEIPYPGKSAKFIHNSGDWKFFDSGMVGLCRHMGFKSTTEDSLIKSFDVLGYNDGSVSISLEFKNCDGLEEYLRQFDLIPTYSDLDYGYKSEGKDLLKVFFNILATNNEIPVSYFEMIRDLAAKGTWK